MTTFRAKRVGYSHTIQLNETPDNVFPLFTPEGEKSWAAGWDFIPVFPDAEALPGHHLAGERPAGSLSR